MTCDLDDIKSNILTVTEAVSMAEKSELATVEASCNPVMWARNDMIKAYDFSWPAEFYTTLWNCGKCHRILWCTEMSWAAECRSIRLKLCHMLYSLLLSQHQSESVAASLDDQWLLTSVPLHSPSACLPSNDRGPSLPHPAWLSIW